MITSTYKPLLISLMLFISVCGSARSADKAGDYLSISNSSLGHISISTNKIVSDKDLRMTNRNKGELEATYSDTYFLIGLGDSITKEQWRLIDMAIDKAGFINTQLDRFDLYVHATKYALKNFVEILSKYKIPIQSVYPAQIGEYGENKMKRFGLAFIRDDLIVRLRTVSDRPMLDKYLSKIEANIVHDYQIGSAYYAVVKVSKSENIIDLGKHLSKEKWVSFAQPNFRIQEAKFTHHPNDAEYRSDIEDAFELVELPKAWDRTQGSPDVAVAVFDSGFDLGHPDLGEGIIAPYDAYRDDNDPEPENALDNHGTAVLGIVGANTDNGLGVPGVGFKTSVVPVKVASTTSCIFGGECININCDSILRAGDHIVNNPDLNVVAVSNSFVLWMQGPLAEVCYESAFRDIQVSARNGMGSVIIAGSGNEGSEFDLSMPLPYKFPFVIGVGANNSNNTMLWGYSNRGARLDIAAPHGFLALDRRGEAGYGPGDYEYFYGTSAATPMVAGIAGLVASANPNLSGNQIGRILLHSANSTLINYENDWIPEFTMDHIAGYRTKKGRGVVNAYNAVSEAMSTPIQAPYSKHPMLYTNTSSSDFLVTPELLFFEKDPAKDYPASQTDLEVARKPVASQVFMGEYLSEAFLWQGVPAVYRAGANGEMIQSFGTDEVESKVLYRGTYDTHDLGPDVVFTYQTEPTSVMMIKYDKSSDTQRIYRLTPTPESEGDDTDTLNVSPLEMNLVHEERLIDGGNYAYGYFQNGLNLRVVRYSYEECQAEFISIDEMGNPQGVMGSYSYDEDDCPSLWTFYRGRKGNLYMFAQQDPYRYTISRIDIHGNELDSRSFTSHLGETDFSRVQVHHYSDDYAPHFYFWDNRGVVKVKSLLYSDYELYPLVIKHKSFRTNESGANIWKSSTFLR